MFIVLVYRPEADDPPRIFDRVNHAEHPFSGIEILGAADTAEGADEMVEDNYTAHADWQFLTVPLTLPEGFNV